MFNFLDKLLEKHRAKKEYRNNTCNQLIQDIKVSTNYLNMLFEDSQEYIDLAKAENLLNSQNTFLFSLDASKIKTLKRANSYSKLIKAINSYTSFRNSYFNNIHTHNKNVALARLNHAYKAMPQVEGKRLDTQQMLSLIEPSYNTLVIAGAGTGKTTTIIGKIKWLLTNYSCLAEEILVLSFTNASAAEMRTRISKETKEDIEASTFHKFGLDIIRKCENMMPKITSIKLLDLVDKSLKKHMSDKKYFQYLISYLINSKIPEKTEFDFTTEKEYIEYLETNPPITLKGETVKSYGEVEIANYLAMNNIEYKYENPYKIDTRTNEYGQYNPDFYLPDYDIYIEYFGINANGHVPSYFSGKNGKSADQTYKESMEWKKKLHEDNNTTLISCYAYEKFQNKLIENLENNLKDKGVALTPKSSSDILSELEKSESRIISGFIELVATVINLLKSNNDTVTSFYNRISGTIQFDNNTLLLLRLIDPIYNDYDQQLKKNDEIDFNDMINKAAEYIKQGKYRHHYKYVIVDEYQDISKSRFNLLKSLREIRDYTLFCVGDDWQSIYRFAGSDIGFILDFEKYWGPTSVRKIETTYRFPQSLINISSGFIMQNPNQVKKDIQGNAPDIGFPLGEISGYTENNLASFLCERLKEIPEKSTVFFLGRYNFDIDFLKSNSNFKLSWNKEKENVKVVFNYKNNLDISFMTAHKSKGLQADYVFIINNNNSGMGFPSKMQNPIIIEYLLENSDHYPYSEERRLFYVALTRAKKKVILLTLKNRESVFVTELKYNYAEQMRREAFTCPLCGGALIKKNGKYGEFWGCANFSKTNCNFTRKANN